MNTESLQKEFRGALRVSCRTRLRLEHAPTGRHLTGRGVDLSTRGMQIRVATEDARGFQPGDGLRLRIDPAEEDYLDALENLCLASVIVRIWPSEEQEGYTNIGVAFLHRLIPQSTSDDSENLHK